jgi:hypothetical protein
MSNKVDAVIPATVNSIALLDSTGNLVDSGKTLKDILVRPDAIVNNTYGISIDSDGEASINVTGIILGGDFSVDGDLEIYPENVPNIKRAMKTPDKVPTHNSDKLITSGAVYKEIQALTEVLVQLNNRIESLEKRIIPVRTFTVSEPYAEIENLDFLLEDSYAVKLISNTPIEISIYAEFYNTSPDAEESYVGDSNSENIKLYPNIQQELDMSKLFAHVGNEIGVYHEIKNLRLDTYGDATVQYPIILEFYKK